ncbi:MAG: nuclear transport factor 2 family protein [Myxococcota bacterium]|nr:nuclear transport factor 2 family protein [Myxococcota bacterium]
MRDHAREIENLLYLYAERIDAGDFEGVGALLGHCTIVTADGQSVATGADAICRLYEQSTRRYDDDGTPHTQHVITNVIVEIDESAQAASARSRFTVLQALPNLPLQTIVAGRYVDQFELVGESWRFRERCMKVEHLGRLDQHLLIDLSDTPHD